MRDLSLNREAALALKAAEAGAIAAIGLRGSAARRAMAHAARDEKRRLEDRRWSSIVRGARASAFDPATEDELSRAIVPPVERPIVNPVKGEESIS